MSATLPREYKNIKVTGPVFVERVNKLSDSDLSESYDNIRVILIMGPTGAGKSTFIEALGLGGVEKISSNQLEGFTQTVSTYRMYNVVYGYDCPIYLVDSPGFADTKISAISIVSMLQKWMNDHGVKYLDRILYLTPVTQVRLPRSQRQVIKAFQALTGSNTAGNITVATTMWDAIGGEEARTRAEGTYKQLESDIWTEFIDNGARIVKFHNTPDSALSVVDEVLSRFSLVFFNVENEDGIALHRTPFAANLYTDLQDRIQNLQLEIATIQSDLEAAKVQDDQLLKSVLHPKLEEANKYLLKFQMELEEFAAAPSPDCEYRGEEDEEDALESEDEHEVGRLPQPQRTRLLRVLDFITGCGRCGKSENHDI